MTDSICVVRDCDRDVKQKTLGYCDPHYKRYWRYRDVREDVPLAAPRSAPVPVKDHRDGTRECGECGVRKHLGEFHRDARSPLGRRKSCKACRVAREAERYWTDPEGAAARVRAFRQANLDHVRAREARYYAENRDSRIERAVANTHKRRAATYGREWDKGITRTALRRLDGDECCYCGVVMVFASAKPGLRPDAQATIEHVVPISRGGTHTWDNCTLACWRCNISKGAQDDGWRLRVGHRLSTETVALGA